MEGIFILKNRETGVEYNLRVLESQQELEIQDVKTKQVTYVPSFITVTELIDTVTAFGNVIEEEQLFGK